MYVPTIRNCSSDVGNGKRARLEGCECSEEKCNKSIRGCNCGKLHKEENLDQYTNRSVSFLEKVLKNMGCVVTQDIKESWYGQEKKKVLIDSLSLILHFPPNVSAAIHDKKKIL